MQPITYRLVPRRIEFVLGVLLALTVLPIAATAACSVTRRGHIPDAGLRGPLHQRQAPAGGARRGEAMGSTSRHGLSVPATGRRASARTDALISVPPPVNDRRRDTRGKSIQHNNADGRGTIVANGKHYLKCRPAQWRNASLTYSGL